MMKFYRALLSAQAAYYFITAVWPLAHIQSFMAVTGPKTDVWLVKTVGALLIPVCVCMLMHLFIKTDHRPAVALSLCSALAFIGIDFYYALNDVISDIYMADGALQVVFVFGWLYLLVSRRFLPGQNESNANGV